MYRCFSSLSVLLIWAVTTLGGVLSVHIDSSLPILPSFLLPISSALSLYVLVFDYGPKIFNASRKDDGYVRYVDLLICTAVWVLSVTNLLFMVWLWDKDDAYTMVDATSSVSIVWLRLNALALFLAPGVGQGQVQAASLVAELLASYLTMISYALVTAHVSVGIGSYLEYRRNAREEAEKYASTDMFG